TYSCSPRSGHTVVALYWSLAAPRAPWLEQSPRLNQLVQLGWGHAVDRNAVVVAEFDHRVAVRVGGDGRLQLLHGLGVSEVVELDRVLVRLEVDDGGGTDARPEHEIVAPKPTDRYCCSLVIDLPWALAIGAGRAKGIWH